MTPSRSERGAGDGRVGKRYLSCGHELIGEPAMTMGRKRLWRCRFGCVALQHARSH